MPELDWLQEWRIPTRWHQGRVSIGAQMCEGGILSILPKVRSGRAGWAPAGTTHLDIWQSCMRVCARVYVCQLKSVHSHVKIAARRHSDS